MTFLCDALFRTVLYGKLCLLISGTGTGLSSRSPLGLVQHSTFSLHFTGMVQRVGSVTPLPLSMSPSVEVEARVSGL